MAQSALDAFGDGGKWFSPPRPQQMDSALSRFASGGIGTGNTAVGGGVSALDAFGDDGFMAQPATHGTSALDAFADDRLESPQPFTSPALATPPGVPIRGVAGLQAQTELPPGAAPVQSPPYSPHPEPVGRANPLDVMKGIGSGLRGAGADVFPKTMAEMARGGDIDVNEQGAIADTIARNQAQMESRMLPPEIANKRIIGDLTVGRLKAGLENLGYSAASALGGMAAGAGIGMAVGNAPGSVIGGMIGAGALSGTVAFRATKDQFVQSILDQAKQNDPNLTQEKWVEIRDAIQKDANLFGLWEAVPEAAGNAIMAGLIRVPLGGGVAGKRTIGSALKAIPFINVGMKRALASAGIKMGLAMGEELLTEGLTELQQGKIEARLGLRPVAPKSLWEAIDNVGPEVLVMTAAMMGMGGAINSRLPKVADLNSVATAQRKDGATVVQTGETEVTAVYPNGTKTVTRFVRKIDPTGQTQLEAWLDSAASYSPQAAAEVATARVAAGGDSVKAVATLQERGYAPKGVTIPDAVVIDEATGEGIRIDALIQLVDGKATRGTFAHERWHVVKALADVTAEENAELERVFGNEEAQANAFQKQVDNGILLKIRDGISRIVRSFRDR